MYQKYIKVAPNTADNLLVHSSTAGNRFAECQTGVVHSSQIHFNLKPSVVNGTLIELSDKESRHEKASVVILDLHTYEHVVRLRRW